MSWYVLYTKPKNERKLTLLLEQKGINVYCPVHEVVKQWSDRKKKVLEPLFKSYVFVELQDYVKENVSILNVPGAVRFLWWLGKPAVVRDEEIKAIKDFLNQYEKVEYEGDSKKLQEGEEVVVKQGIFKDKQGTVLRIKGNKVILRIDSLGWDISAEIDKQSLIPLINS